MMGSVHLHRRRSYPCGLGLGVGVLVSSVSLKAIRGWKCDFLLICNRTIIVRFFFFYIKCSKHIRPWKHAGCWVSPKCRKTLPSFLAMFSWSLPRRSLYCCCLIFVTMYSASCREGACKEVTQWLTFVFHSKWLAATAKMSFKSVNVKTFVSFYEGGGEIKKTETVTVFFDTWMWRCVVCFVFCLFYY